MGTIDNLIYIYELGALDLPNPQPHKIIQGNQGWALCMMVYENYLYVGTDDKKIKLFETKNWDLKEELTGSYDGITTLAVANGMLYSGSFDHIIRSWDIQEIY